MINKFKEIQEASELYSKKLDKDPISGLVRLLLENGFVKTHYSKYRFSINNGLGDSVLVISIKINMNKEEVYIRGSHLCYQDGAKQYEDLTKTCTAENNQVKDNIMEMLDIILNKYVKEITND